MTDNTPTSAVCSAPWAPYQAHTYNHERTECIWCGPNQLATQPGRWVAGEDGFSAWSVEPTPEGSGKEAP